MKRKHKSTELLQDCRFGNKLLFGKDKKKNVPEETIISSVTIRVIIKVHSTAKAKYALTFIEWL